VQVRDTVGAGDAVNGVLAAALDTGLSLREALPWAVGAGSVAVTRSGACAAMPTRAEVLALLEPA
jgi:ribokinase